MNNTYDIEQVGQYFVGYHGKQEYYGKTYNEVAEQLKAIDTPTYTIVSMDENSIENSISETLELRDKYMVETYGYTHDEVSELRHKIANNEYENTPTITRMLTSITNDSTLWEYAYFLSDTRQQLSKMNRDNAPLFERDYTPKTRVYGDNTVVYPSHCYPRLQPISSELLYYADRVVMYKNFGALELGYNLFATKTINSQFVGFHKYLELYYRFYGFESGILKALSQGKRTNKRANDKEICQVENSTPIDVLKPLTPQTRKQRKSAKAMGMISEYQTTDKHSDIITIDGKSKELVCGTARDDNNHVIYNPIGGKIYVSSKTAYNYIAKTLKIDLSMIPAHKGNIVDFVYNGHKVTVERKIVSK